MSPDELRKQNVAHLSRVLARTTDPEERARIARLIDDERAKPDAAYPWTKDPEPARGGTAAPRPPERKSP